MSYIPTDWQTGDIVTAEKLNKLENGVASSSDGSGGGAFVIGMTREDDGDNVVDMLDKTWKEIHDALASGQIAIVLSEEDTNTVIQNFVTYVGKNSSVINPPYQVIFDDSGKVVTFYATTENDCPSRTVLE